MPPYNGEGAEDGDVWTAVEVSGSGKYHLVDPEIEDNGHQDQG